MITGADFWYFVWGLGLVVGGLGILVGSLIVDGLPYEVISYIGILTMTIGTRILFVRGPKEEVKE